MYKIQVKRKKVKNITIRVQSETLVTITAPTYVDDDCLKKVIKHCSKWIEEKIEIIKNRDTKKEETLNYLGECYPIELIHSEKEGVVLKEGKAYIYAGDTNDYRNIDFIIKEWYYKKSKEIFGYLIEKYEVITGNKVAAVKIKPMKTRWGSCNTIKSYINLNLNLIEKPIECIEYVVLHEIAHLTHPNHSAEFWNYVAYYMSDFEERRQKLK